VDQPPGGCILIRRKAIEEIGLFDENFFLWFEDVDLCYRLKKRGYSLYYLPSAEFVHAGGGSIALLSREVSETLFFSSLLFYFRKHFSFFTVLILRIILGLDLLFRIFFTLPLAPFRRKNGDLSREKGEF